MKDLQSDPCFVELNNVIAHRGSKKQIRGVVEKPCHRSECPIHGQQGIAVTLKEVLGILSEEELAASLRRAMGM